MVPHRQAREDSSIEFDWQTETKVDIFGDTYATGKKATKTQAFDPCELDGADKAQQKIWNLAIKENNVNALLNQDMLIVHLYAGTANTAVFAERYSPARYCPLALAARVAAPLGCPLR